MERGRLLDGRRERLKWDHQNNYCITLPLDTIDFGLFLYNSKAKSFGCSTDTFSIKYFDFSEKNLNFGLRFLSKKIFLFYILLFLVF